MMGTGTTTIRSAYEYIKKGLSGIYPDREIHSIASLVLEHLLKKERHELMLDPSERIAPETDRQIREMVPHLRSGKPVQHILGFAHFFDMELKVCPAVLIPRPETGELVAWVLEEVDDPEPVIWDIGTGSGCIALALKKNLPGSVLIATDDAEEALAVARENAVMLGLDIRFIRHDILGEEWPDGLPGPDIIVSNPPYIPIGEKSALDKVVADHDPHGALFVPDDDPLVFYRAITGKAVSRMTPNGRIFFEIHESFGNDVRTLFTDLGCGDPVIRQDIHGKDRLAGCRVNEIDHQHSGT